MTFGKPGWDRFEDFVTKMTKTPMVALDTFTDSKIAHEQMLVREGCRHGEKVTSEAVVKWLEGLARRRDCPEEKRFWYEDVAADIRLGVYKNA